MESCIIGMQLMTQEVYLQKDGIFPHLTIGPYCSTLWGGVKTAAYKLKSKDGWEPLKDWDYDLKQSYLIKGFTGGLNYQGFNALPAGWIGHLTGFNGTKGWIGKWWSTTANYSLPDNYSKYYMINDGIYYWESQYDLCYKDQIIIIEMIHRTDEVEIASQCKLDGYSVRCVKD